jgi:hypothetical protein
VVRPVGRLGRLPESAQVWADDSKAIREERGNPMPGYMSARMAVQKKDRRSRTTVPDPEAGLADVDEVKIEPFEHADEIGPSLR